jgi:hypothetical protein
MFLVATSGMLDGVTVFWDGLSADHLHGRTTT